MNRINILHISDLHFCADDVYSQAGTVRDESISKKLKSELTYEDSKHCFYSNALNIFGNKKFELIACTGDLGYQNLPNSIEKGAEYIGKLADMLGVRRKKVLVAPGNHDLNRKAKKGKELDKFINVCSSEGFTFPIYKNPAFLKINGVPVVVLNSCLGGTEHALHGVPKKFWDIVRKHIREIDNMDNKLREKIPNELKYQLQAMDIPAVGRSQLKSTWSYLTKTEGNYSIVLCHHNPFPSHNLEIRPYSSIVDSGHLVYGLMEQGRRVFILHGHTHCELALTTHTDEQKEHGFVAAIGSSGLFNPFASAVTAIQILTDSKKNFLAGMISRYIKRGDDFSGRESYQIFDIPTHDTQFVYQLDKLESNRQFSFTRVATKLKTEANDDFAATLLKLSTRRQLRITDLDKDPNEWMISKIG